MACEQNPTELAAYLDGELAQEEAARLTQHVRACSQCAGAVAEQMVLRRSLAAARGRYAPDPDWKRRMLAKMRTEPRLRSRWFGLIPVAIAASVAAVLLGVVWMQQRSVREEAFREVADLHVSDLASDHPVDVVSTDRHTVKPWFAGRIPFSFNVPELAGTEFTLIGGRVAYLEQEPGAQLLVGYRQHRISVLIFRDATGMGHALPEQSGVRSRASFNVATWRAGGLRFVVIGDADAGEMGKLAQLFRQANP